MDPTLKVLMIAFAIGLMLNRHTIVRIALVSGIILGVMYAEGWLGSMVHTLGGAISSIA